MPAQEKVERRLFDPEITDRERAVFEGGIALAALYHQFLGTPITKRDDILDSVKDAIERAMMLQPYRERVEVKILKNKISNKRRHPYDYETLKGKHLDVRVVIRYGKTRATVRMKYVPELDYNLMYVEKLKTVASKG